MTLQTTNQNHLAHTQERDDLLKKMFANLTQEEYEQFKYVCNRTGLDPFIRQIYPVKRKSKDQGEKMTIQTGIDGYRLMADRTGKYMPGKETTYQYSKDGSLLSATAYVKKLGPDNQWHEIPATAFWSEYVQTDYNGNPSKFWKQMPHGQLGKCAEALALRKAFPADMSGVYTHEEMAQASVETISVDPISTNKQSLHVPQPNPISSDQYSELLSYLDMDADEEYVMKILLPYFSKKIGFTITSLNELPVSLFEDCRTAFQKRQANRPKPILNSYSEPETSGLPKEELF